MKDKLVVKYDKIKQKKEKGSNTHIKAKSRLSPVRGGTFLGKGQKNPKIKKQFCIR
jgi:hypothetical protein